MSTFAAFLQATPKSPERSALIAVIAGAAYAGLRAAVGFLAMNARSVPTIVVDE